MMFQMISRNNDPNGNPYRLLLVYGRDGHVIKAYEARSSSPNIAHELRARYSELPSFHVAPAEYKATKRAIQDRYIRNPNTACPITLTD